MSTKLLIQLASYSHSFLLNPPVTWTILELKQEIARVCAGNPKVEGQRVIWQGRVLDNTEVVGELWRPSEDTYLVFLAISPTAWTAAPPPSSSTASTALITPSSIPLQNTSPLPPTPVASAVDRSYISYIQTNPPPIMPAHVAFMHYLHINALRVLCNLPPFGWPYASDVRTVHAGTKIFWETVLGSWPAVLDQPYPEPSSAGGNLEYRVILNTVDNLPYLQLISPPEATPSPTQHHALSVLTYTFPLLHQTALGYAERIYGNRLLISSLERVVRARGRNAVAPFVRPLFRLQIPIRPLIAPLFLLTLRTTLLVYFLSPSRKPWLAALLLFWVAYEIWTTVRAAMREAEIRNGARRNANNAAGQRQGANHRNDNNAANRRQGGAGVANDAGQDIVLDRLSHINLDDEPFAQNQTTPLGEYPEPTLFQRMKMFVFLFFLSVHPALWDRRRAALRLREGRAREALHRERQARRGANTEQSGEERGENAAANGNAAPHVNDEALRPQMPLPLRGWVRDYLNRVQQAEWVDE